MVSIPLIRYLGSVVLAWMAGSALQLQQAVLWPVPAYAVIVVASALLSFWLGRRLSLMRLFVVLFLLGWLAFSWCGLLAWTRMQSMPAALEGRDLDVQGMVESMPQRQDTGWRFRFRIEHARWHGQPVQVPERVYLGWYSASSRKAACAGGPEAPQAGERWQLRVRLKAAHGHINPRGFDYELWLWEQGVRATGYVRQGRDDPSPQRVDQTWSHPVEWARQQVRDRMLARMPTPPQGPNVWGILAALVTGDQAAIDRSEWDVFRATGVSHLMSISGVHVTMLGWLMAWCASALWRRSALWGGAGPMRWPAPQVGAVVGLLLAAAYALFSGWGVPAQRTVWMLVVATVLRLSGRDWHWRHVWALAGAAVVLFDPWALLQPGFWLSFVAVGVLMATGTTQPTETGGAGSDRTTTAPDRTKVVPGWLVSDWLRSVWRRVWGLLREQALITLALLPLSLLFFGQFSLVGLLANLIAIPWVTLLVTPLALLGMVLPWIWHLAEWCLMPLVWWLMQLSTWRWASVSLAMPPWPLAVMALSGTVLLVLRGPWSWRLWGVPLMLPALIWQPPRPVPGAFELLVADVGQGNAVLVRTARHSLLYDAGPRYSPESDAGHRVLVPLLAQSNEQLDVLMLSHRDTDHTGGAQAVLAMQPQAILWSSLEASHPLLQRPGHRPCEAGHSWVWDGVRFELLHPQPGGGSPKPNALSCVLQVQGEDGTALLAGDIEAAQERDLVERGLASADLLLVPHHGSRTSSSDLFLDAIGPRLALVQAGYRNRFGHPAPEVVQRYRDRGVRLIESVWCGAATWRSAHPGHLHCERESTQRYWRHRPGS